MESQIVSISILSNFGNSNYDMHQGKLSAIADGVEPNKFNPVPHKKEATVIMQQILKRRARNEKQHKTENVLKNA
jgi:uncharacterized protein (UPF0262 family)